MIFNNVDIYEEMYDHRKFIFPLLKEGSIIELLYDDTSIYIPGIRGMKKGEYLVKKLDTSVCDNRSVIYCLISTRKNSKYIFPIHQIPIDKAIGLKLIKIVN